MSEKRFKVDYEVGVLDTKTNEIVCDTVNANDVVDLLNELAEENGELKKDMERLERNHQNLHEKYEEMEQKYKEYYRKYDRIRNNTESAKRVYLNLKECFEDE